MFQGQEIINGRYILANEIGRGGMGAVFLAQDRLEGCQIALKRVNVPIDIDNSDPVTIQNTRETLQTLLAREFQTLASLRHPHIISVLDYGFDADHQPYYTMNYLPNSQTILEFGKGVPFDQKIQIVEQLLQGLAYLHRRGILHRDIKPENVLVLNGEIKLLDFGLSHQIDEDGFMGGSPLYMAPELIDGGDATRAADLYSVGVLLFTLFAGVHPFGPFNSGFYQRVFDNQLSFAGVPTELHPIVGRLLDKDPAKRYQNVQALLTDLASATGRQTPIETEAIRESYLQAAQFIGREAEMMQLIEAMAVAKNGSGCGWLIGGESGSGKSRLSREIEIRALVSGFKPLQGQAVSSAGLPYQLLRKPIRHLVATTAGEVPDQIGSTLKLIVPDIEVILNRSLPTPPELDEKAQRDRLVDAIVRLFKLQNQPVLLLVEDMQWDDDSLPIIAKLNEFASSFPLFILGTYRTEDWITRPAVLEELGLIKLNRFDTHETTALAKAMLGSFGMSERLMELLQKETEGNAFFLVEIVRSLAERAGDLAHINDQDLPETLLPQGIKTIIDQRMSKIDRDEKHLLQLAAIAGRQLDLDLIRELSSQNGAGQISIEQWLVHCDQAAILIVQNDQWLFSHDKIREGLLADIPSEKWQQMHAATAVAFEQLYSEADDYAERIALLWREAEDEARERPFLMRAAALAATQFRNNDANGLYARAFTLTDSYDLQARFDILLARTRICFSLGLHTEQESLLKQMEALAFEIGDPNCLAELYLRYIFYDFSIGDIGSTVEHSLKTIEYGKQSQNRKAQGAAYRFLGSVKVATGAIDGAISDFEHSLEINLQAGNRFEIAISQMILGGTIDTYGRHVEAQQMLEESFNYLHHFEVRHREAVCVSYRGTGFCRSGEIEKGVEAARESYEIADETGDRMATDLAPNTVAQALTYAGRLDEALECSQEAINRMRQNNNLFYLCIALQDYAEISMLRHAWRDAQNGLSESLKIAELFQDKVTIAACHAGLARAAFELNESGEASLDIALTYLRQHETITNIRYPITFSLNLYYAMQAEKQSRSERSFEPIEAGYQLLQSRVAQFKSQKAKWDYLNGNYRHRKLLDIWEANLEQSHVVLNG